MTRIKSSTWLFAFAAFLFACGFAGWAALSFDARGKTAILSGSATALSMLVSGLLARSPVAKNQRRGEVAAAVLSGLFVGVFSWRVTSAWLEVVRGNDAKLYVAALLSAMAVAALATFVFTLRRVMAGRSHVAQPSGL